MNYCTFFKNAPVDYSFNLSEMMGRETNFVVAFTNELTNSDSK